MSSKFEELLDYLVNEEHDKANELFHEIVVEKSREIYENLIAEEEEEMEEDDDTCDEGAEEDEEDESMDEAYGEEDEESETIESMFGEMDFGGDKTDDLEADVSDDEFGMDGDMDDMDDMDDMGGDDDAAATKGDIMDLEDAIEELKAEFESLLGSLDSDGDGDHDMEDHDAEDDMDMDMDDEDDGEEEEDDEEDEEMKFEGRRSHGETMREYIEKVTATMDGGLVGARTGETMSGPKEGKSPISSGSGKPTSGATAKNIATHQDKHSEDGQKPHGKVGGLVKSGGQFVGSGTKNVASSASAKKPDGAKLDSVKKPGNKEGQGWGSGSGDKAGQTGSVDTKSPLSGAPNRAK